ncbi:permease [Flavobacterium taihuense]|uniref:Permease n=1 Tax=Flavobacterium taihuense TaxID=2857508 RepID=A0ABS6XX78_9FLAO|nr:permease [Flavobacterium taihuense]MBW4360952.1 permease [Flavobacterium taihuense]
MFDWLQHFADWLIYSVFSIEQHTKFGDALNFFVFDTLKIALLLFVITTVMGIVNSYFPVDKVRNFLSRNKLYGLEYLFASAFGVITPFCSCSSVPLFIGFVKGGIPLGITFTYLITAPLVNEVAIAIFLGAFGFKITAIYVISGIVLGVIGGFTLGKLKLEKELSPWVQNIIANAQTEDELEEDRLTLVQRFPAILKEAFGIVKGVSLYIIIGIAIGGLMHGFLPTGFFEQYINKGQWYAVPLAVIIGVPMYSNAAGVIPVVQVLVAKGVPLGTAIAFMMGVIGLSLPEAMLLKKVMNLKMIAIYFGTIAFFMILSGYLFNIIL